MKYSIIFILFSVLIGCGPMYKTVYQYQPPRNPIGQVCIAQCSQTKSYCEDAAINRYDRCQRNAEFEKQLCDERNLHLKKENRISCWDNRFQCHYSSMNCADNYRICYQNCGGHIQSKVICTANCEQKK